MPRPRVQVRDLEAPPPIQPAPLQSDTFEGAPRPVINHDMERLAQALGTFSNGLLAAHSKLKKDAENELKARQLGEWEKWKATRSNAEQLAGIRSGDIPISANGPLSQLIYQRHAQLLGERLGSEMDAERGTVPYGRQDFDPDAYVREKAAPYLEEASRDYRLMSYFGEQLTRLRQSADAYHRQERGKIQTGYLEREAREAIKGAILKGIEAGRSPQEVMDGLTKPMGLFRNIGPVKEGGSLDVNYARLGELHMDVLEELAGSPATAKFAMDMLHVRRLRRDGQGELDPYGKIETYRDKIAAVERKAVTTLSAAWQDFTKGTVRERNIRALESGSPNWLTITEVRERDPFMPSKELHVSPEAQRKEALNEWFRRERQGITQVTQQQLEKELGVVMAAGEKHPELGGVLENAFKGAITTQAGAPPGVDGIQRGVAALRLYDMMADRNWEYAREYLSGDARRFFDLARTLVLFADRTPEQAVSEAAAVFTSGANKADPKVQQERIAQAVDSFKVDPWYQRWFSMTYTNPADALNVRNQMIPIVEALALTERRDPKDLVEKAANYMAKNGVNLNGRFVMDGFVQKGDERVFQSLLDQLWEQNKDFFKAEGIPNANHLSVQVLTKGKYVVTRWDGGHLFMPTSPERDKDGRPLKMGVAAYTAADIAAQRKAIQEKDMEEARRLGNQSTQMPSLWNMSP